MEHQRRVLRFLLTGLLLLGFIQGYNALSGAFFGAPSGYTASAEASSSVPTISALQLEQRVQQTGKHKLVFLYASWCPHCRRQHPIIDQLASTYEGKLDIIKIATDRDIDKLAVYLDKHTSPVTTHRLEAAEFGPFRTWLGTKGSSYNGGIPHSIILDANGQMVDEVTGVVPLDSFKEGFDQLL